MRKLILTFLILTSLLVSCSKNDKTQNRNYEGDSDIKLGQFHNTSLDIVFENFDFEKDINNLVFEDYVSFIVDNYYNPDNDIISKTEVKNQINNYVKSYFYNGNFIFKDKKKDLKKVVYNELSVFQIDYIEEIDNLIALELEFNEFILRLNNVNKDIINDNNLNQSEKFYLQNILSVASKSAQYWGNNMGFWKSKFEGADINYKNQPNDIIPLVPNCRPGYCWKTVGCSWEQYFYETVEADFWGAAGTIAYTWWAQGSPVGWGTAAAGASVPSIVYTFRYILDCTGGGCKPC